MKTVDGRLHVVSGVSRSGKTWYVIKKVARKQRVIVFDTEDQFSQLKGFVRVTSKAELLALVKLKGSKKIAYIPSGDLKKAFDFWAGCAFYWVRYKGGAEVVAEELSDVTTTAKAPNNWGILIRRGLKRGANIWAISQRWAEADKTTMGNASVFVCFKSVGKLDCKYLSDRTDIDYNKLIKLKMLQYIIQDNHTCTVSAVTAMK